MSDELAALAQESGGSALAELPAASIEVFEGMGNGGDILPYITLQGSNSDLVKLGSVERGVYTLTYRKGEYLVLGKEFDCVPIDARRKALDIQDKKKPIWSYDPATEVFQYIRAAAESKIDSEKRSRLYGVEILLYLPDVEQSDYRFATLFMGNASGRVEAPRFRPVMRKSATIKNVVAKNDKGIWEAIKVFSSQRKIEPPSMEDMQMVYDIFKNPKEMPVINPEDKPVDNVARG